MFESCRGRHFGFADRVGCQHKQGGDLMSSKLKFLGATAAAAMLASSFLSSSAQAQLANEKNLTLAMAQAIANGAMEKCKSMGYRISVEAVDRAGLAIGMLGGDGA